MSATATTDDREDRDGADGTATNGSVRRAASALLAPRFGIDPRALAAFRIAVGLVVLGDLLFVRLPGVRAFYTDAGVFPRSTLATLYPPFESASLHALSGDAWFQYLLLGVAAVAALSLTVGYRTRIATAVSAILLASLHARNPLVLNGGDTILLSLLVLGLFLPLGVRWSVDTMRRAEDATESRRGTDDDRVLSVATGTILVHFVVIYAINGAVKFQSEAWMDGTATPRIFHLEQYIVWLGPWVANLGTTLVVANWAWVALLCGSVLLLVFTDRLRAALAFAFVGCELGLAATMRLGAFPFVMVAALLLFLPPRIWDRLEAALKTVGGRDPRAVGESIGSRILAVERAALPSVPVGRRDVPARTTVRRLGRVTVSVVLVCFLVAVVTWQLAGAGFVDSPTDVDEIEEASWSFFAPNPPDAYWWYAWEADLEGGETVGTLTDGAGEIDRPPDAADTYPSVLWKRYGTDLRYGGDAHYEPLADYRCRRVADDSTYDGEPETVRLYHVEQPVTVDGRVGDPVADLRLEHDC